MSATTFEKLPFDDYKKRVLSIVQERLKYFAEIPELTRFFFVDLPIDSTLISENKQLKKMTNQELYDLLQTAKSALQNCNFEIEDLTTVLNQLLADTEQKPAVLFSLIRIATTSAPASPAIADTLHLLGKERSLSRIDSWLETLQK